MSDPKSTSPTPSTTPTDPGRRGLWRRLREMNPWLLTARIVAVLAIIAVLSTPRRSPPSAAPQSFTSSPAQLTSPSVRSVGQAGEFTPPHAPATTHPADPLRDLLAPAADPSTPVGAAALQEEPAGLPSPRALDPAAQRLAGFTRGQGDQTEEFALWRLPGTRAEAAAGFYLSAAEKAGLRLISRTPAPPGPATTRPLADATRFLFADAGAGLLVVRVASQESGGVKVTVWRRPGR